jgi:purine-binding chemotaxis protein CheW
MALYLIVTLAGERVALLADDVDSVVEIERITPVPRAPRHIAGLAALRSRVLTIIDSATVLDLTPSAPAGDGAARQTVVVTVDGHLYGIQVSAVEDVVELTTPIQPIRGTLAAGWARVALGLIELEGNSLLLLDPGALIAPPPALAA